MKISGIIKNDVVNGIDVCVSLFMQGCPHHCPGCFNKETWDFNGGQEVSDLRGTIVKAISENGVLRNFSILGGEPLCDENISTVRDIIFIVRTAYYKNPIKIFVWTGYTLDELKERAKENRKLNYILNNIDYLIDGRFEEDEKDLTLWLRGSRNQKVYQNIDGEFQIIAGRQ